MTISATKFGVRRQAKRDAALKALSSLRSASAVQKGFTLIELILVMTLLAIVLAVSSPALSKFFKGRGLDNESRRFLALTRHAQSRAVAEGVPMVLWFDAEARTYGLNADKTFIENDAKAEQFAVEPTIQIEIQHSAEAKAAAEGSQFNNEKPDASGLHTLRFNPDGFASAGTPESVVFRQEGNGERRVVQTRNRLSYEIQPGQPIQSR